MLRNLIQTGNSKALILTKDMRDHLGIEEEVEVEFRRGSIVLRHPEVPDEDSALVAPKKVKEAKEKAPDVLIEEKPKEKVKEKAPKEVKLKALKPKEEKGKSEKDKPEKLRVEKSKGKDKKRK